MSQCFETNKQYTFECGCGAGAGVDWRVARVVSDDSFCFQRSERGLNVDSQFAFFAPPRASPDSALAFFISYESLYEGDASHSRLRAYLVPGGCLLRRGGQ